MASFEGKIHCRLPYRRNVGLRPVRTTSILVCGQDIPRGEEWALARSTDIDEAITCQVCLDNLDGSYLPPGPYPIWPVPMGEPLRRTDRS